MEKLFAGAEETELQFFAKAHVPFLDNEAAENAEEDREINRIYQMIYQLGTEKTREQLREIGVIRGIRRERTGSLLSLPGEPA